MLAVDQTADSRVQILVRCRRGGDELGGRISFSIRSRGLKLGLNSSKDEWTRHNAFLARLLTMHDAFPIMNDMPYSLRSLHSKKMTRPLRIVGGTCRPQRSGSYMLASISTGAGGKDLSAGLQRRDARYGMARRDSARSVGRCGGRDLSGWQGRMEWWNGRMVEKARDLAVRGSSKVKETKEALD